MDRIETGINTAVDTDIKHVEDRLNDDPRKSPSRRANSHAVYGVDRNHSDSKRAF